MEALLECRGLGKRYGETDALVDVHLAVEAGELRGLVGHNGAGKSTLLRCALGLVRHDAGEVRVLGRRQQPRSGRGLDGVAGLVDGTRWPGSMTAESVLRMMAAYDRKPRSRVDDVIERMSLDGQRKRPIRALSLGGRQRLGVAAALLRDPKLLLLDEPVNGLDPAGRRDLRILLRELAAEGAAVVISSHDLAEIAATCDTVTRLDNGRVSWTSPLAEVAHTALKRVRCSTTDDVSARAVLLAVDKLSIDDPVDGPAQSTGLTLRGSNDALDQASLALGRAGIAIRAWDPQSDLAAALLEPAAALESDEDKPPVVE